MSLGSARLGGGVPIRAEKKYEGSGGGGQDVLQLRNVVLPGVSAPGHWAPLPEENAFLFLFSSSIEKTARDFSGTPGRRFMSSLALRPNAV